jgi:hypothetical protein
MMAAVWETHCGVMCAGLNWERFLCLSHAQVKTHMTEYCKGKAYLCSLLFKLTILMAEVKIFWYFPGLSFLYWRQTAVPDVGEICEEPQTHTVRVS